MKHKHNEGFSLIEVIIAIVLLGALVVPTCSSLVLAVRLNGRTEEMMQAQLAVSSAVETLMAEGITEASDAYDEKQLKLNGVTDTFDQFPEVTIKTEQVNGTDPFFRVTVASNDGLVEVTTYIRAVLPPQVGEEAGSQ